MTARADSTCWSIPMPPRQTGRSPPRRWMSRSRQRRRERRRCAPEEPRPRLHRDGMHHDERVHPAPMGGPDQQVAARRQVLLARGPDPEPEDDEQDEPGDQPEQAIRGSTPSIPVADRAMPGLRRPRPGRPRGPPVRPDPAAVAAAASRARRSCQASVGRSSGAGSAGSSDAGSAGSSVAGRPPRRPRLRPSVVPLVGLVLVARRRLVVVVVLVVVVLVIVVVVVSVGNRASDGAPRRHLGMRRRGVGRVARAVPPEEDQPGGRR